ncbi:hypothetical protein BDK51DRAFT_52746 [Blyttiomyces helicus]|uniref:Uncharacterized protein n=1 Tax=Blyttiomyces helicus TaxID=388810 RepID=A0A4P9VZT8_9FUNG|nr:hypothetical protein BDK51DRAFT_52746 [Blyttiomyces helicus]|eukprot:RKO85351.1 hypothetical protein BDK51DRAFT_52746 [Blyttiomyces helicus]
MLHWSALSGIGGSENAERVNADCESWSLAARSRLLRLGIRGPRTSCAYGATALNSTDPLATPPVAAVPICPDIAQHGPPFARISAPVAELHEALIKVDCGSVALDAASAGSRWESSWKVNLAGFRDETVQGQRPIVPSGRAPRRQQPRRRILKMNCRPGERHRRWEPPTVLAVFVFALTGHDFQNAHVVEIGFFADVGPLQGFSTCANMEGRAWRTGTVGPLRTGIRGGLPHPPTLPPPPEANPSRTGDGNGHIEKSAAFIPALAGGSTSLESAPSRKTSWGLATERGPGLLFIPFYPPPPQYHPRRTYRRPTPGSSNLELANLTSRSNWNFSRFAGTQQCEDELSAGLLQVSTGSKGFIARYRPGLSSLAVRSLEMDHLSGRGRRTGFEAGKRERQFRGRSVLAFPASWGLGLRMTDCSWRTATMPLTLLEVLRRLREDRPSLVPGPNSDQETVPHDHSQVASTSRRHAPLASPSCC